MEIVRGNDISISWRVSRLIDGVKVAENLLAATNLLVIATANGLNVPIANVTVSDTNLLTILIKGRDLVSGIYALEASWTSSLGEDSRIAYGKAFTIVDRQCQADYTLPEGLSVVSLEFDTATHFGYLYELYDVLKDSSIQAVAGALDGNVLTYDSSIGKWIGKAPTGVNTKRLDAWGDYTTAKFDWVLSAALGYELYQNKLDRTEISSWALAPLKPTYTADEIIGLSGLTHSHPNKPVIDLLTQVHIDVLNKLLLDTDGRIKALVDFYSVGEVSAYGFGGTGGTGSAGELNDLSDVDITSTTLAIDDLLKYDGTHWVNVPMSSITPNLTGYINGISTSGSGNVVTDILKSGSTLLITKGELDLSSKLDTSVFTDHINNVGALKHLTAELITLLTNLASWWQYDSTNNAIYSTYDVYSTKGVSAYGLGPGETGSTVSPYLNDLLDVTITSPVSGQALVYDGAQWINQAITAASHTHTIELITNFPTTWAWSNISGIPSVITGTTASFTTALLNKLNGINAGAEVNVLADWNVTDSTSDAYILNKPDFLLKSVFDNHAANLTTNVKHLNDTELSYLRDIMTWWKLDTSGNLYTDLNVYSTKEVSAYGLGTTGSSGSGIILTVHGYDAFGLTYDSSNLTETFNAYAINELYNDIVALQGGSATSIVTTGTGNAITSLTKSGSVITADKGLTFALSSHTHTIAQITGLQGALDSKATPADIDTAVNNLQIGGRNLLRNTDTELHTDNTSGTEQIQLSSFPRTFIFHRNSEYVFSFDLKGSGQIKFVVSQYDYPIATIASNGAIGSDNGGLLFFDTTSEWKRVWVKITTADWVDETYAKAINLFVQPGADIYGNYFQLENGNKPTDWTPAPEDQVSDWSVTDVNSFAFIKNKPTLLSQFTDNIGVATHIANTSNPHNVTKAQVGLGNVLNVASYSKTESDAALVLKLNKSVFDDLFEKVEVSTGVFAIKAKYDFYSVGEVSAFGAGTGGGGTGYERLDAWADYNSTKSGWVLSALLGVDLNTRVGNLEGGSALTVNTTGAGNAITSISKAGTVITATKGLTFSLSNHLHTGVYEPVFTKNTAFNKNFGTVAGTVAEGNHTHTFASLTSKPTTLAGYEITNAYTKTEVDTALDGKASLRTRSSMTDSYRRFVIGVIRLDGGANAYSRAFGTITMSRVDGLYPNKRFDFSIQKKYNVEAFEGNVFRYNSFYTFRLCKFLYNGVLYGGFDIYVQESNITSIDFIGQSPNWVVVEYYNTSSNTVINSEINDSLVPMNYEAGSFFANGDTIYSSGNLSPVTTNTVQTITAQKTFNDGDANYGLSQKPSIILGVEGSKGGAIRLNGTTVGYYGLIHNTTTGFNIDQFNGGILHINAYGTGNISMGFGGGSVGIGNTSPSEKLDVTGNVSCTGLYKTVDGLGGLASANVTGWSQIWCLDGYALTNSTTPNTSFFGIATKYTEPTRHLGFFGAGVENAYIGLHDGSAYFAGKVGMGTTSPSQRLHVAGNAAFNGYIETGRVGTFGTYNSAQTQGIWSIGSGYNVSASTTTLGTQYGLAYSYISVGGSSVASKHQIHFANNGSAKVTINLTDGNVVATGEVTAFVASDRRLKDNIKPIYSSLEIIDKLNPVTYYWNDIAKNLNPLKGDELDYGLIAQEVEEVLPNIVHGIFDDKYKSIDYIKLIPIMISAIKELKQKVNKL